jgi:hypothetical protein
MTPLHTKSHGASCLEVLRTFFSLELDDQGRLASVNYHIHVDLRQKITQGCKQVAHTSSSMAGRRKWIFLHPGTVSTLSARLVQACKNAGMHKPNTCARPLECARPHAQCKPGRLCMQSRPPPSHLHDRHVLNQTCESLHGASELQLVPARIMD